MYKNNSLDSNKLKGFGSLQLLCNLTESATQLATILYLTLQFKNHAQTPYTRIKNKIV